MSSTLMCIKCLNDSKYQAIFICAGCEQRFCPNHSAEHRDQLRLQFENVINECDSVQELHNETPNDFVDRQKESLTEIRRKLVHRRQTLDYLEKDLDEWTDQLHQLKQPKSGAEMEKPGKKSLTIVIQHRWRSIYFAMARIPLEPWVFICLLNVLLPLCPSLHLDTRPKFTSGHGPIEIMEEGHVAIHNGVNGVPGSVRINQYYSSNVHYIQFTVEWISSSSQVLVGVISHADEVSVLPTFGWWLIQEDGNRLASLFSQLKHFWSSVIDADKHVDQSFFRPNDTFKVEINCLRSEITLQNQRTGIKQSMQVPKERVSMPWQIVINLNGHGDRIRLN